MAKAQKVVLIGLESVNPDLVYHWKDDLPSLSKIMNQGVHGGLNSIIPPSSAPAWSCVLTGGNPGQFGFWDSIYRENYSYKFKQINSRLVDERTDTLHKILSPQHKKVALVDFPLPSSPQIADGYSIGFHPGTQKVLVHPSDFKNEFRRIVGEYITSISTSKANLQHVNKDVLLNKIRDMDRQRFKLTTYFLKQDCDFVFALISGTDVVSRLFYHYLDEKHPRYTSDAKYKDAIKNHYMFCDENIGKILNEVDDKTAVIILSSFGAQRLDGRVNLNEWFIQEGYLSLKEKPEDPTFIMEADVDWSKTKAWSVGSSGQIYLNAKGREPEGVIDRKDYGRFLDELAGKLQEIKGEKGEKLNTTIYKRRDIHFGKYARFGPDVLVCFNNYHVAINDFVGYDSLYCYESPQKQDYATPGPYGFLSACGPGVPQKGRVTEVDILDVAPTILDLLGISPVQDMEGELFTKQEKEVSKEEEEMRERLSRLGYLG